MLLVCLRVWPIMQIDNTVWGSGTRAPPFQSAPRLCTPPTVSGWDGVCFRRRNWYYTWNLLKWCYFSYFPSLYHIFCFPPAKWRERHCVSYNVLKIPHLSQKVLKVGTDTPLFSNIFSSRAVNVRKWRQIINKQAFPGASVVAAWVSTVTQSTENIAWGVWSFRAGSKQWIDLGGRVGLLNSSHKNASLSDNTQSVPGFVLGGKFSIFKAAVWF